MTTFEQAIESAKILSDKKAVNLSVIKITELSSLGDYMVLATGNNSTHVKALADELEFQLKGMGVPVHHIEGHRSDTWILMDYTDVIVHIFSDDAREYYGLDRLWQDGEIVDLTPYIED
ncbi:MAG: ribosome silencing factor [Ruminococcus sp.]|nr:ribosome silencing factor [Oscillospiraceae bacterium]MBR2724135.1 ribosome silencing factor [Ruminococcus sp.]